jgi:hypothetical protein
MGDGVFNAGNGVFNTGKLRSCRSQKWGRSGARGSDGQDPLSASAQGGEEHVRDLDASASAAAATATDGGDEEEVIRASFELDAQELKN